MFPLTFSICGFFWTLCGSWKDFCYSRSLEKTWRGASLWTIYERKREVMAGCHWKTSFGKWQWAYVATDLCFICALLSAWTYYIVRTSKREKRIRSWIVYGGRIPFVVATFVSSRYLLSSNEICISKRWRRFENECLEAGGWDSHYWHELYMFELQVRLLLQKKVRRAFFQWRVAFLLAYFMSNYHPHGKFISRWKRWRVERQSTYWPELFCVLLMLPMLFEPHFSYKHRHY